MVSLNNWAIVDKKIGKGGQGKVSKVRHKSNNVIGSLKMLLPSNEKNTERRSRFAREIIMLKGLTLAGVPKVLESNEILYEDKAVPLYMVYEWIEGEDLLKWRPKKIISIDLAISITLNLLSIVEGLHLNDIIHRDIKPDNIIINDQDNSDLAVYLIDFGISWLETAENKFHETQTQQGLGNRFLELPELKPGRNVHDGRSDITYIVGVLFYLLFNKYPRILADEHQKKPHENLVESDFRELFNDKRWPKLRRIFHIGFETNIDLRFNSADELRKQIETLNTEEQSLDELERAKLKIKELFESNRAQQMQKQHDDMLKASRGFIDQIQKELNSVGLGAGGSGPNIQADQKTCEVIFFAIKGNTSSPKVRFALKVVLDQNQFQCHWSVGKRQPTLCFKGSSADVEGLELACKTVAMKVALQIISDFTEIFRIT